MPEQAMVVPGIKDAKTNEGATRRPRIDAKVRGANNPASYSSGQGSRNDLVPSDDTLESLKELENGGGKYYSSLDGLWADLDS